MNTYIKPVEIRWADLDPNFHVLHSHYYDFGAFIRVCYFVDHGITLEALAERHLGPILFREECQFRREVKFGDAVTINLTLQKARKDASRWTIVHQIMKNGSDLAAQITVDGAWIDTQKRKLSAPPEAWIETFLAMPRAGNFEWI